MKTIDPLKGWYSAQELAGLPGLPGTERGVFKSAQKNLWAMRAKARGKGNEYALRSLPAETQAHIASLVHDLVARSPGTAVVVSAPGSVAAVNAKNTHKTKQSTAVTLPKGAIAVRGQVRKLKDESALDDRERAYRDAALVLCQAVTWAVEKSKGSVKTCCTELATRLVAENVDAGLLQAAHATYLKPRQNAGPLGGVEAMAARLQRLMAFFEQGRLAGDVGRFLVPGKREKEGHNPIHVACFLQFFCRPTRPPVAEAYRAMKPWLEERGLAVPSYTVVTRIEHELPVTVKYRGRVTGSEWRSLKPYVDRDVSMFKSNDIWVGDGHSFKAKVQHPIHGRPFTPEITFIRDWVSRKIVGWSVSLSESTVAVSDAFRHAQKATRARPLVYYSDNGGGQTGKMIDCPIAGTLARQGIAHETGIPGNPQGRGIIESLWMATLIPLAREYPTCTWRGADENATNKMLKKLNTKDQGGISIPSFRRLLDDVERAVASYNLHHEHSALGGLAPEDVYQGKLDKDSIVFGPTDAEIHALWMPEVIRKPTRGVISLFGNEYFKRDLVDVLREGARVRVRYDLHDPDQVWLLTIDGVFLGTAAWNGHRVAAFPVPEIERLRALRAAGKIKRGERIIEEAQAEMGQVYDLTPATPVPVEQPDYLPEVLPEAPEEAPAMSHEEMVQWLYGDRPEDKDDEDNNGNFEVAAG